MIGGAENAPRNGFYVTDAAYNTRSSIRRVSEHHIVPAEVCDGQGPARSTSCGCDVGVTLRHPAPFPVMFNVFFYVTDVICNTRSDISPGFN